MSQAYSYQTHKASETLGLWEPKRTLTLEAARRHSRRIRLLRRLLTGLAVLLVIVLILQFLTQQTTVIVEDNPDQSVKMTNPRYSGRTKDGLPYWLTADAATRMTQNATNVDLVNPVLNFVRVFGAEPSVISAEQGQYDDVNQILNLTLTVDLKTDNGYHCETTHARIFARDKRIEGDEPIKCDGSFGQVNGQSYEIFDAYSVFVFKDGMNAYLEPEATASSLDPDTGQDATAELRP